MIAAILMIGMTSFAQDKAPKSERAAMEKLTPEQRNQLQLKELTLQLDLNAFQQSEMAKILADASAKREATKASYKAKTEKGQKMTATERFEMKNKMLDEKIAMKEKLKKVLSEEQMGKWEKIQEEKKSIGKRMMKGKDHKSENGVRK